MNASVPYIGSFPTFVVTDLDISNHEDVRYYTADNKVTYHTPKPFVSWLIVLDFFIIEYLRKKRFDIHDSCNIMSIVNVSS